MIDINHANEINGDMLINSLALLCGCSGFGLSKDFEIKKRSWLILIFFLFVALGVVAQVSNVEGIEPIKGVTIPKMPKEQISQEKIELPRYLQIHTPIYPAVSRRLGEEGVVIVRVLIGSDGIPEKVEIQTTSGFERLDQEALKTVMRWRFVPGMRGGVAEAMWSKVPVNFKLHIPENDSQVSIDLDKQYVDVPRSEQEDQKAEDLRQQAIKRLKSLGASDAGQVDLVNESKGSGRPSDSYLGRLRARVKPNITFSDSQLQSVRGNPAAEVEVIVSPSGQIVDMRLTQPSGNADWDQAVLKALEKTGTLPRDENGKIPPKIPFRFRPRD